MKPILRGKKVGFACTKTVAIKQGLQIKVSMKTPLKILAATVLNFAAWATWHRVLRIPELKRLMTSLLAVNTIPVFAKEQILQEQRKTEDSLGYINVIFYPANSMGSSKNRCRVSQKLHLNSCSGHEVRHPRCVL